MDNKIHFTIFIFVIFNILQNYCYNTQQLSEIPYTPTENICKSCVCLSSKDTKMYHVLSCATKNFKHILAGWPEEFGTNHTDEEITAIFSGNTITLLQQIPQTDAILSFSCRHCGIKDIQSPAFIDTPNILRLDLSWNQLTGDILRPDIFRGPYNVKSYEPIKLEDLDLSHNQIHTLDKRLFEHTPYLKRLNLGYNKIDVIDLTTSQAIGSVSELEFLDLSYNGLENLPESLFQRSYNLKELILQGNHFKMIPNNIKKLHLSLISLNFGGNLVEKIDDNSFKGLKLLEQLNISELNQLQSIDIGSFSTLNSLKVLLCRNNPLLTSIDIDGLKVAINLKELDISSCALKTLTMDMNDIDHMKNNLSSSLSSATITTTLVSSFSTPSSSSSLPLSSSSSSSSRPASSLSDNRIWPKLRILKVSNNPWNCDCMLIRIFEKFSSQMIYGEDKARCTTPYDLAGSLIYNLTSKNICDLPVPRKLKIPIHDPNPTFLKPKSIALSIISVTVVFAFGLIIGFTVVIVRRKLRKNEFGFTIPIRYTTVRNSIVSVE